MKEFDTSAFKKQADLSREVLKSNREKGDHLVQFAGREYVVFKDVFSPAVFNGWRTFTPALAKEPLEGKSMLEVGCGSGITGLHLLLEDHLLNLVMSDINPAAVKNAQTNIDRLGVRNNAQAVVADVLDGINSSTKFDAIYWNHPWIPETTGYTYKDDLERSLFDPGYDYLERYLQAAKEHLLEGGVVYLGFGDFGDQSILLELLDKYQYDYEILANESSIEGDENAEVRFILYKLVPRKEIEKGDTMSI